LKDTARDKAWNKDGRSSIEGKHADTAVLPCPSPLDTIIHALCRNHHDPVIGTRHIMNPTLNLYQQHSKVCIHER
jgi:hypothetical protein